MFQTCSIYACGVKYSHFTLSSWQNYMKNWLLMASFVLCCQFQNSTLAMMCAKIKVGFHCLNLTYSQTSFLGLSLSTNYK